MSEDRIQRAFDLLDRPASPDPSFRDALYERLREEVGRRPRRLHPAVVPSPRSQVRRVLTIAATLGLTVAVLAAILGPLRDLGGPTPGAVGPFGSVPPFKATLVLVTPATAGSKEGGPSIVGTSEVELAYAGPDAWRYEVIKGNFPSMISPQPGSVGVWDGRWLWAYDAASNTYDKTQVAPVDTFSPLNLLSWEGSDTTWRARCPDAVEVGREILAGRSAIHLSCPPDGPVGGSVDLWIDAETGFVLKILLGSDVTGGLPLHAPFGVATGGSIEVTKIDYDPTFAPGDVTWIPPDGAVSQQEVPPSPPTTLALGQPVPTWSLPALDGSQIDLASLRGKPTIVYVWASWCDICAGSDASQAADDPLRAFDRAFLERTSTLALVSVASQDDRQAVAALVDGGSYVVPVVLDASGSVLHGWGAEAIPLLVVIDANGNLAGAYVGDLQGRDVRSIVDAVAAGEPLPDVGGTTVEQLPA